MTSTVTYAVPLEELWGVFAAHQLWLVAVGEPTPLLPPDLLDDLLVQ